LNIEVIEVIESEEQIRVLYEILEKRSHNISHLNMPTFKEHSNFVKNHPYRKWYLIKKNNLFLGSTYIQMDNTVSINLIEIDSLVIKESIEFILDNHKPLEGIPSVRSSKFNLNVPATNQELIDYLSIYGSELIEMRYVIEKK
jgi:hypothetical protein